MKQNQNKITISIDDNPNLLERAFSRTRWVLSNEMSESKLDELEKITARAKKSINSSLRLSYMPGREQYDPNSTADLYITPDQLEIALIAYGVEAINGKNSGELWRELMAGSEEDLIAIDGLLKQIDLIKTKSVA